MLILLLIIIGVLLLLVALLAYKYRCQSDQIRHIEKELGDHLGTERKDRIMVLSDEKAIQDLLVRINQLIDQERGVAKKQRQQEISNRKMLSNISHDLKTPLTVISGYAQMLENEVEISPGAKQKITKIQNKIQDLLAMIAEFFDVVKIEAGEFPLKMEPVDICEVCREELLGYYQMIEDARIELVIELEADSIIINGDRLALKRIFANLIDNAVKYGMDGRYLKVRVYQDAAKKCIEVIDHGKGIVEDNQDKVFERLFTLEDSRNKKYQGSGIGLTITRRLAEAMNGTLTLKSVPYEETVFKLEF